MTCLHDLPVGRGAGRAKLRCMTLPGAKARAALALSLGFLFAPLLKGATPKLADSPPAKGASTGCLPAGNGFLRARIRGAMNLDVNWKNAELECDGGARPDGNGIRLSFAGPLQSDGRRLRMVFGVSGAEEGNAGSALPTNLTVIFEGEKRLFATRGDDKCTVDKLQQERVGELGGDVRSYRVIASGFCIEPANALNAKERIVVSSIDFAGSVTFTPRADTTPAPPPAAPTPISR
jgi:hypothetical protein